MRADYSHITLILDRSGSMATIRSDVLGGVNTFLKEQQALPGHRNQEAKCHAPR